MDTNCPSRIFVAEMPLYFGFIYFIRSESTEPQKTRPEFTEPPTLPLIQQIDQ